MRPYLLLAMLVGIGWLVYRHLTTGRSHVRLLAAVTAVTLVTGVFEMQWRETDARYTTVAAQLLHHPHKVAVHCERLTAALASVSQFEGYVPYDQAAGLPTHAQLMRNICKELGAWVRGHGKHSTPKQVIALHVFVHEVMHLDGVYNEAAAECEAMQRTEQAAVLFGAAPGVGQRMAQEYWRVDVPNMPDDYRGDCAENGPGDDSPNDGVWP